MGLEQSAIYTLTGPDGHVAVFNDPASANFVGYLTEPPAGIDSPDIREAADDIAQGDGGIHYDFFYTRRTIVLTGVFYAALGAAQKAQIERLQRASNAMRGDATLSWSETGDTVPRKIFRLRRQQRLLIADSRPRTFQLQLVSEDAAILTDELAGVAGTTNNGVGVTQSNLGTAETPPRIVLSLAAAPNAALNPIFKNTTTGSSLKLLGTFNSDITLDLLRRTVTQAGIGDIYGKVDWLNSTWWGLVNGANKIEVTDSTPVTRTFTLYRRYGWI